MTRDFFFKYTQDHAPHGADADDIAEYDEELFLNGIPQNDEKFTKLIEVEKSSRSDNCDKVLKKNSHQYLTFYIICYPRQNILN